MSCDCLTGKWHAGWCTAHPTDPTEYACTGCGGYLESTGLTGTNEFKWRHLTAPRHCNALMPTPAT